MGILSFPSDMNLVTFFVFDQYEYLIVDELFFVIGERNYQTLRDLDRFRGTPREWSLPFPPWSELSKRSFTIHYHSFEEYQSFFLSTSVQRMVSIIRYGFDSCSEFCDPHSTSHSCLLKRINCGYILSKTVYIIVNK
jgi:hypothetical protein